LRARKTRTNAATVMADTARCYAAPNLATGSFATNAARTRSADPAARPAEIAYVNVGARQPSRPAGQTNMHDQLRAAETMPRALAPT